MPPGHESSLDQILDRLNGAPAAKDPEVAAYLDALRQEIQRVERNAEAQSKLLREYEEAYEKLTAPANRLGVFLGFLEGDRILVASGETDYVALFDPKVARDALQVGSRVMLNEAFAVVGVLPTHTGGATLKVAEADEHRLRVGGDAGSNTSGRWVLRGSAIAKADIKKGDEVRIEPMGRVAVEHHAQTETQDYFVEEVPQTPWSSVGGQAEAIAMIRETIEHPLLYPELYARFDKKPVKGILLYGPPGCGKTLIGKAIAYNLAKDYSARVGHEVKEYFMHISGPKILNMWLGETERMVREIFDVARNKAKDGRLVVIFMDEAESILRTRSNGRYLNISNTVVPQFCAEMDGLVALENVVLVLTSNRPDYIDPAILRPERIDRKVKIVRPDKEAAKDILGIYLHDRLPIDPDLLAEFDGEASCARKALVEGALAHLWRETKDTEFLSVFMRNGSKDTLHFRDLVSGALLKSVVDRAKDTAIRRAIAEPSVPHGLSLDDLREAIDAEYKENEIFPKSDVMEDWLKLIDVEPESVANVRPVQTGKGEAFARKQIV